MISEVHILGQLWQRCLEYQDYQRCTAQPLHKCFFEAPYGRKLYCVIFPIWKSIWDLKGAHPCTGNTSWKGTLWKECCRIEFSCMIYSLEHIALKAQTASWVYVVVSQTWKVSDSLNFTNFLDSPMPQDKLSC